MAIVHNLTNKRTAAQKSFCAAVLEIQPVPFAANGLSYGYLILFSGKCKLD